MNGTHQFPDSDTDEQASLWAARLEGRPLAPAERAELDAWLGADPARRAALEAYCRLSSRLDRAVPELLASGSIEVRYPEEARARAVLGGWRLAAAGMAAAALAVGAFWMFGLSGRAETLSAAAGQRQAFTLSDGTRIELNANTSVVVELGRSERRVKLANGEAFFVVSKDKARPFIVDTPAGSVRVTGTIFNVLTEATSQLDVTVVEGSVQVRPGDSAGVQASGPVGLGAGDRLTAAGGEVTLAKLTDADLDDELAWRQGMIVCNEMPLSDALAQFAHYHGKTIVVTPGAAALRVGGRYRLDDLDAFLAQTELAQQHQKVRVERGADGAIRVSLAAEP
jgi:transmembrane sensor